MRFACFSFPSMLFVFIRISKHINNDRETRSAKIYKRANERKMEILFKSLYIIITSCDLFATAA